MYIKLLIVLFLMVYKNDAIIISLVLILRYDLTKI